MLLLARRVVNGNKAHRPPTTEFLLLITELLNEVGQRVGEIKYELTHTLIKAF